MTRAFSAIRTQTFWPLVGLGAVLGLLTFMLVSKAGEPLRGYGHGYWADARVLMTAERFASEGFLPSRLAPHLQIGPLDEAPMGQSYPYLHSQPLTYLSAGFFHKAGIRTLWGLRIAAILFHAAGMACFFWLLLRITQDASTALLAASLASFALPLYIFADSLAQNSYVLLFTFGPLLLWHVSVECPRRRASLWFWVNVLFLLQGLYVFVEYWLYAHAFLWLYAFVFGIPWRRRHLLWLAPGHVLALGLTLARNAWYLGLDNAVTDLTQVVLWRIGGFSYQGYGAGSAEGAFSWAAYIEKFLYRFPDTFAVFRWLPHSEKAFLLFMAASLGWLWWTRRRCAENSSKDPLSRSWRLGLVLFGSALPYFLMLPQHAMVHYFPIGDFAPGVSVLTAAVILGPWNRRNRASSPAARRSFAMLSFAAAFFSLALNVDFCRRFETDPEFKGRYADAQTVDRFLPSSALVGHSTFLPTLLYYTNRPFVQNLLTPEAVEHFRAEVSRQHPDRPLYFVMAPPVNAPVDALWPHLDALYVPVLEIPSLRMVVYDLSQRGSESVSDGKNR
jgi:hypothetical protein